MTEKERAISELQGYLRNLSRTDPDIERVVPDGIFGEETERSVRSFQRKYGLPEDGVVNYEVWTRIREENDRAVFLYSEPRQVARISNADLPLTIGMRGNAIYHLKAMLLFLSQRHDNFSFLTVNDVFDSETERSVRQWQRVIRVPVNGIVDKVTWNALADYYTETKESTATPL